MFMGFHLGIILFMGFHLGIILFMGFHLGILLFMGYVLYLLLVVFVVEGAKFVLLVVPLTKLLVCRQVPQRTIFRPQVCSTIWCHPRRCSNILNIVILSLILILVVDF